MDQINKYLKYGEKNINLINRGAAAYPIRQDLAELKKRHEDGDKNVIAYLDGQGRVERYELEFTQKQRDELERAYWAEVPKETYVDDTSGSYFVGLIERWGGSIPDFLAIEPPIHKTRQRAIDSFVKGIEKMDAALAELDSSALGWLYANVVDKLACEGLQVSPDDGGMISMRNNHIQAMVEAGELRGRLRRIASSAAEAAANARDTLPKSERVENDPRFKMAQYLERQIIEEGIAFSTNETGFAAQCLRAIYELGGLEVEKVGSWLKKAADAPDSFTNSRQQMRNKTEGKNTPAL